VTDFGLCDDGIPCTFEWCYLGRTCRHDTDDAQCNDGVACTTDRCDAVLGCVSEPDDSRCPNTGCGYATCDPQTGCTPDAARCDCVALRFAGHERVSAPDSAALSGGTNASRTFELWLRLDALEERGWGAPILTKVNGETGGDWALTAWGDDLVFRHFRTGTTTPETFVAPDILPPGAWTHVAVVVDRGARRVRLLVNGREVLDEPASYDMANSTAPLYVGATPKLWPGRFEGALDEVRVWTVARATAAIAADHDRPLAGTETGLAAYWPFGDAVDRTRRDTLGLRGGALTFAVGANAPAAVESVLGAPTCPLEGLPPLLLSKYWYFEDQPFTGAYLEVANPGPDPVALGGYAFELSSASLGTRRVALADVWLPSGGAWAVFALDGQPQRSVTPSGEGSALLQQQETVPMGRDDTLLLVDTAGAVVDSFGSRAGPSEPVPDPDGDGIYFASRACEDRVADRDPDDPFALGSRWVTAREALPDPISGRWCGRCGQVVCPDGGVMDGACSRAGYCLRYSEAARAHRWSDGYGSQLWIPPSEQAERQVRFVDGYFVDVGEAVTRALLDFLDERGANSCAVDGASYPCVDAGHAERTLDWDGSAARARSVCQSEPAGATDWSCTHHPAAGVTWAGAAAFCAWLGQRLCSDSEWQRAAAGPAGRTYPWGSAPSPATGSHANCRESACADGWSGPAPTQRMWLGASACGAYHMGGNVWEWVADDWHLDPLESPPDGSAWLAQPPTATKTLRGGGYESSAAGVGTSARAGEPVVPTSGRPAGVRCCGDGP
jgi:formylglycine-generating enzyme required for sulfatase activity